MQPLKLIHTADWHFGDGGAGAGRNEKLRGMLNAGREQQLLELMIRAKNEGIAAVVIAGDLFHREQVDSSCTRRVAEIFEEAGSVPVLITPGNHDPYTPDGLYARRGWPSNVHIFNSPEVSYVTSGATGITFYGWAWTKRKGCQWPQMARIRTIRPDEPPHVFIGHGSEITCQPAEWERYAPFELSKLDTAGLSYIALGHLHWFQARHDHGSASAVYPGSPVALGFQEQEEHGYIEVTFENGRGIPRFVDTGGLEFRRVTLNAPDLAAPEHLRDAIYAATGSERARIAASVQIVGGIGSKAKASIGDVYRAISGEFAHLTIHDLSFEAIDVGTHPIDNGALAEFLHTIEALINAEKDPQNKRKLTRAREHGLAAATLRTPNTRGMVWG